MVFRAGSISSSIIDENRDMIDKFIFSCGEVCGNAERYRLEPIDRNTVRGGSCPSGSPPKYAISHCEF